MRLTNTAATSDGDGSDVVARIRATFGAAEKAERWLSRPTSALNGHAPVDLLASNEGRRAVLDLLGRIDYGLSA